MLQRFMLVRVRSSAIAPAPDAAHAPHAARIVRAGTFLLLLTVLAALSGMNARAADADELADFELTVQPTDTLIGISNRLLIEPNRWPELQKRNNIADPRRLVPGSTLLIPRRLLRVDPAEIEVRNVIGAVTRADGTPLVSNERLAEGAAVRTADNGYVTLQLVDGSTLRLQPRSELKVERTRRVPGSQITETQVEIPTGRAEVKFTPPVAKASRFQIRTGFASAAVRGTEFRVSADERGTRSEVTEGAIAFAGIPAGSAQPSPTDLVSVGAGFGSVVDDTRVPIPPVQLLSAPLVPRPQVLQISPNFRLRIPPVTGAVRYRVTVAADAAMQQVRREEFFTQPDLILPNMEPGNYVIQVRAIDRFGLEGRDARVPLTMIAGKPAAAPAAAAPAATPAAAPAAAPAAVPQPSTGQ